MALEPNLLQGDDYQELFDPNEYLGSFYGETFDQPGEVGTVIRYNIDCIHRLSELIPDPKPGQKRILVDLGCGPNIHGVLSLSAKFEQIYMAEYTQKNRDALQLWLECKQGAHDWTPVIKHVAQLEGN